MVAKIIDGRKIAKQIRQDISDEIKKLQSKHNLVPCITTIKIGSNPESELYLKLRNNACKEVGIKTKLVEFPEKTNEKEVLKSIHELNQDCNVHGILIQFPIPGHISRDRLIEALNPDKDVEGLHPFNIGRTLLGDEYLVPCTPLAVLTIMEYEKIKFKGLDVVIVNHSDLVGKPLAALFLNRNSTVSVCHVFTKDAKKYTSRGDVLVTATGVPKLITGDFVKKGVFVIDVGISKTNDGVCGDVDFDSVKNVANKITPVPGGVGPVTVACSLINMVKTFRSCLEEK